jgi:hypothetical protein
MPEIIKERLEAYRANTFHTAPGLRIASAEEAVAFVDERGFTFFWPIKGVDLPSVWVAAAGDRPVPNEHDDPGHITWGWKDSLLGKKRWYYARLLRRRNAMISLQAAPYFYALSPNYGDPENDYLEEYRQGSLSMEARLVYEALLREGPLDTLALRKAAGLSSSASTTRFNRALDDLQIGFKILPVGVSQAGAWHYAFIYDITARHMPELVEQARFLSESASRRHLTMLYFQSVGAAPNNTIARLFGWIPEITQPVIQQLVKQGLLVENVQIEGNKGELLALPELTQ